VGLCDVSVLTEVETAGETRENVHMRDGRCAPTAEQEARASGKFAELSDLAKEAEQGL